ncbi:TPA: hypothetical protein DCX15_02195 [bacterium]|nr:hypothetical protein [bacterium]
MKIAMSKTREQFPLSKKKPLKKTIPTIISSITFFIMILIVGLVSRLFLPEHSGIISLGIISMAVILLIYSLLTYQYQIWYFQVYFYDLTDDFIIIRKGVFTPREITIPYERVQDVYVDQDLWDRLFGLYDVHLSTATISSGLAAHIDGVEKMAADGLREKILKRVSERIKRSKITMSNEKLG